MHVLNEASNCSFAASMEVEQSSRTAPQLAGRCVPCTVGLLLPQTSSRGLGPVLYLTLSVVLMIAGTDDGIAFADEELDAGLVAVDDELELEPGESTLFLPEDPPFFPSFRGISPPQSLLARLSI
ncbi:hypothetical protein GTP81_14795 [Rugamonas sp. FT107W]|uniref:Uncharacterized protein n=1 Tax=Duganella vulcania TaxID=2692166 RepID=A0A845HKG8_9BURK|nr:hypothetical protein [Duganella vulcania]MYN18025.1 hypothetical protein [Duganella vulcania]